MQPAGWPRDLPPSHAPEFAERVVPWLLDRGPAELRTSGLRLLPVALAAYVRHHIDACLGGARTAYRSARTELAGLPADELERALSGIEAEGARLLQVQREVMLVRDELVSQVLGGRGPQQTRRREPGS